MFGSALRFNNSSTSSALPEDTAQSAVFLRKCFCYSSVLPHLPARPRSQFVRILLRSSERFGHLHQRHLHRDPWPPFRGPHRAGLRRRQWPRYVMRTLLRESARYPPRVHSLRGKSTVAVPNCPKFLSDTKRQCVCSVWLYDRDGCLPTGFRVRRVVRYARSHSWGNSRAHCVSFTYGADTYVLRSSGRGSETGNVAMFRNAAGDRSNCECGETVC